MSWKTTLREFVPPIVMKALRPVAPSGGYIPASDTVAAAKAAGLSVGDYVERLWGIEGQTTSIMNRLPITAPKNIVEIGAGTGLYLEHTLKRCHPDRYQVYEIDKGWSDWLAKTYPVEVCTADGRSLRATPSNSVDFIHAHGVFVYLPFLISYRYFKEILRVAAPEALVVFDFFSEASFARETVDKWIESGGLFPCFLSAAYVRQFFEDSGFRVTDSFSARCGVGFSEYLVFSRKVSVR
jgi:SAM-dependent methyltransferase